MEKINIRFMTIDDIAKIQTIEEELKIHIFPTNQIANELKDTTHFGYYVASYQNEIVGYIGVCFLMDSMDLNQIVVKKNFQKKGIATLLLHYIFKLAQEKKITSILLEVRKSNLAARSLYEKNGFSFINTRKNYYTNPLEDALIYLKEIKII